MLAIHSASLVIPLANLRVTDSLTLKIKTSKIPETWILVCFAKNCAGGNYQPYCRCIATETWCCWADTLFLSC